MLTRHVVVKKKNLWSSYRSSRSPLGLIGMPRMPSYDDAVPSAEAGASAGQEKVSFNLTSWSPSIERLSRTRSYSSSQPSTQRLRWCRCGVVSYPSHCMNQSQAQSQHHVPTILIMRQLQGYGKAMVDFYFEDHGAAVSAEPP